MDGGYRSFHKIVITKHLISNVECMTRPFTFIVLSLLAILHSYGQNQVNINVPTTNGQNKDFIPASPSAASLGIFGQIPVGNYTGTAVVSLPLHNIAYKELQIPVGISYHASGNKPDFFPGIVGLSWALNSGGAITRVVKGMPDYESYDNGQTTIPVGYNPTGDADWSSLTKLNTHLSRGGFIADQDRTNPDEFYFNFNDITGKFYMNQLSEFKVRSTANKFYKVAAQVVENKEFIMPLLPQSSTIPWARPYNNKLKQKKMIYKVIITDDMGIQYIFGGTDNSIEFSRPGHSFSSLPMEALADMITPMTWHLTSIISPNGYTITLDYERGYEVTKVPYCDVTRSIWRVGSTTNTDVTPLPIAMAEKSTLVNACYLKTITTPKETIALSYSEATEQLQFPKDPSIYADQAVNENMFTWYDDISYALTENLRSKKLDSIVIRDARNELYKTVRFDYTSNTNVRLKLMSVRVHGNDYKQGPTWYFGYNGMQLPPYLSYKTDHYGFYNGRNPYINTHDQWYYVTTLNQQDFFNSKEPDTNFVQAELLNRITYPTGGYTEFEYEPNVYSTTVQTWPFTTVTGANRITGGVRIKRATDYAGPGQKALSKRYHYVKNYLSGGTTSSGVLSWQPIYYEQLAGEVKPPAQYSGWTSTFRGNIEMTTWSSNPIFPLGATRGNHVTYSEVTVAYEDGGASVYKYKNYDNGYNDHPVVEKVSDNATLKEFWKEEEGISMDIERGQPLSEEHYDATKAIKKRTLYEYNDDTARFRNHVRVLAQTFNSIKKAGIPSLRLTASLIYTYYPYLKKETETVFENGQQLTSSIDYLYDTAYRLVKQVKTVSSDGKTLTRINKYPADMGTTAPYPKMVSAGLLGVLVSTEQQSNGIQINKDQTDFAENLSPNTALILPQAAKTQFKGGNQIINGEYLQYDVKGNVASTAVPGGPNTCYIYSYNYLYPVAKIVNADYATVVAVLGGQQAVDNFSASIPSESSLQLFLQPLRTATALSAARVYTYAYHLLNGMTTETDPNNRNTYYGYDYMGRLNMVKDQDRNILRKLCYNYAGQVENCDAGLPFHQHELHYSTSAADMCNGVPLQVYFAYTKRPDPDAGLLYTNDFFINSQLTSRVPDGYYKVHSSDVFFPQDTVYHQIQFGRIINTYSCNR